ncbi:unnamed protein product [Ambrosiozyma monospora]|uniref:Unnamed protein product n=1 Tax=Ambrosiozyma monospora TaxID=43982 RepID=A0A9W7DH06_AMBMO|nr:unnamed protein product [Ambrosiozyma monospora]
MNSDSEDTNLTRQNCQTVRLSLSPLTKLTPLTPLTYDMETGFSDSEQEQQQDDNVSHSEKHKFPESEHENYSDYEEELLRELQKVRDFKKKQREMSLNNELINSEDEEDPRLVDDSGQQTSYFKSNAKHGSGSSFGSGFGSGSSSTRNPNHHQQQQQQQQQQHHQQNPFSHKQHNNTTRNESKAEQPLRQKIQSSGESHNGMNIKSKTKTQLKQESSNSNGTTSFMNRFLQLKEKIKKDTTELQLREQQLAQQRKYGFDMDLLSGSGSGSGGASGESEKVNEKDPYSGKYLSRRTISAENLKLLFEGMKLMRIEQLLSRVTPPDFVSPLDKYANFVVFGVVCGKSDAKMTGSGSGFGSGFGSGNKFGSGGGNGGRSGDAVLGDNNDDDEGETATANKRNNTKPNTKSKSKSKSKYMTIQITNFQQQLPVTLLSHAFHKYWKLQQGTVIGILNPSIYAFPDKSGFAITVSNDSDCILELGHARDFGFCKAITKSGKRCSVPVELRRCDLCDFHAELQFKRTASKRAELDGGGVRLFDPVGRDGRKQAMFVGGGGSGGGVNGRGKGKLGGQVVVDSFIPKY